MEVDRIRRIKYLGLEIIDQRNELQAASVKQQAASDKLQASSYKLWNFLYIDSSDKQQASSRKPQATSCKQREPS
jgi:hypothetical protein